MPLQRFIFADRLMVFLLKRVFEHGGGTLQRKIFGVMKKFLDDYGIDLVDRTGSYGFRGGPADYNYNKDKHHTVLTDYDERIDISDVMN